MNCQIWVAVSLTEFNNLFIDNYKDREEQIGHKYYVCVDIANGHILLLDNHHELFLYYTIYKSNTLYMSTQCRR